MRRKRKKERETEIYKHGIKKMVKKQRRKTKQCAKVYKYCAADSLTETTVLNAYFCHDDIIYHRDKKPHRAHEKRKKCRLSLICLYYRQ